MSLVLKVLAVLAAVTIVAGAAALGVVALSEDQTPEVITLRSEPAATPAPEPDDRPLWPEEARRARRAALAATGGGRVSELDRSDDPGEAYEVEVIKDGREYDIALDLDFKVVPNRRYDD